MKKLLLYSYLIKTLLSIVEFYSKKGDYGESFEIKSFLKRIFPKIIESLLVTSLVFAATLFFEVNISEFTIANVAISFFASILGFGMAAYTIMLMFTDEILEFLNGKKFSAQILNADMAFPLTVISIIVFILVILSIFENCYWVKFTIFFLFLYGLLLVVEIIRVIYLSMSIIIKKKSEKLFKEKEQNDD